jgi:hypothetical protein
VNAADNVRVSRVDYYIALAADGPYYFNQTKYWPFDWPIDSSGGGIDGHYFVKARAYDDIGNYQESTPIEVWVLNR